jgi:hypothetical protein
MFDPFDFSDFGSPRTMARTLASNPAATSPGEPTALQPVRPDPKLDTGFDPFADAAPRKPATQDAFGIATPGATASAQGLTVARPPLRYLALAIVLAAAGVLIAGLWGSAVAAAAVGWFLAGPAAIGVLAVFTLVDTRRRTDAVYSAPSWIGAAYWAVVVVCLIGIAAGAWELALWAGRR